MKQKTRRRRETKSKDIVVIHSAISDESGIHTAALSLRKPLHHHKCRLCAKSPNLRRQDICRGNARCRCRGCRQIQETGAPPYKVRVKELNRF